MKAKSLENRITEDSIYKMFSYANLYLCLQQIDTVYTSYNFKDFEAFVDYLCSCSKEDLERIAETFKVVLSDLCSSVTALCGENDLSQRTDEWVFVPNVMARNKILTVTSFGLGWYAFEDIEHLRETARWSLEKFIRLYAITGMVDVDAIALFRQVCQQKKNHSASKNRCSR
jgi:hypothetical protein